MSANREQLDVRLFTEMFKQTMIQWEKTVIDSLQPWLSDQQPQANIYLEISQAESGVLEGNKDNLTRSQPTEEKAVTVLATQATCTTQGEYAICGVDLGGGRKMLEADLLKGLLGPKAEGKKEGFLRWGNDPMAELIFLACKQLPFENG